MYPEYSKKKWERTASLEKLRQTPSANSPDLLLCVIEAMNNEQEWHSYSVAKFIPFLVICQAEKYLPPLNRQKI